MYNCNILESVISFSIPKSVPSFMIDNLSKASSELIFLQFVNIP